MAIITVQIYVADINDVMLNFDKMQVQRSKLGDPYTDAAYITAAAAEPPVVVGTVEGPYPSLNGEDLKLLANGGVEQSVVFASANPVSLVNAVGEINGTITNLTADDDGTGKLRLTGTLTGTGGTIEVTGGSAPADFGLSQVIAHGQDPYVGLETGITEYTYVDLSGEASYWYRTRYYNITNGTFGGWSDWIQGSTGATLASGALIVGKIRLAGIDGQALQGKRVTLVNVYNPLISDDYFIAGSSRQIVTDVTGSAESTLVKGMLLDVVIEGTSLIRRIQVPDIAASEFDLLDPDLVVDDAFHIQEPDLPSAVRRS